MPFKKAEKFDFEGLFIFEMANNHQGSVKHGLSIINAVADISEKNNIRGAVKLQFRDLDTFIHPEYRDKGNKSIERFLSTRLSDSDFAALVAEIKKRNLVTICTPFDEPSVDKIENLGIEIIKVGSPSVHDWPLLEKIAENGKPVICSVGGLSIREVDKVVSFFRHRGAHFALMHCVGMYPAPNDKLFLNQIEIMRNRYPGITIGFSTHEAPSDTSAIQIAYAKGARLFEKHVGVAADGIKLNAYSANPEQVENWVKAYKAAVAACGNGREREIDKTETEDLRSFMRGVYAKTAIKAGAPIRRSDIFFAIPLFEGQLSSDEWEEGMIAESDYCVNQPVRAPASPPAITDEEIIHWTIHAIKGMLNEAHIPVGYDIEVELSHHCGLEHFHETGCVIIKCINREYAKKLMVQLPGQWNPVHHHKKKDETFQLLKGTLQLEIEGEKKFIFPGEMIWIPRGVWHGFGTETGAIFEEISTRSFDDDSFYADKTIARMDREKRKTRLINWGHYQLD